MNNFDSVYGLDDKSRRESNTEYQDGDNFLSKGKTCLEIIKDKPEYENIKNVIKGIGKCEAIARVRNTYAGNPKYCLVLSSDNKYFVYLYSAANGLYNKMGPFPTLDSALSRSDCYGLFEEKHMKRNRFNEIRETPLECMRNTWRKYHSRDFVLQDLCNLPGAEEVYKDFCKSEGIPAFDGRYYDDDSFEAFVQYLDQGSLHESRRMTKRQLFENIFEETSDKFLVIDGGLDGVDDTYWYYLAEDGTLQEFNDGELPDDAMLNPSVQEINNAIIEMFKDVRVIGGKRSIAACAKKVSATNKSYVTLLMLNDDYYEDEKEEVYKDVKLLSVNNPDTYADE